MVKRTTASPSLPAPSPLKKARMDAQSSAPLPSYSSLPLAGVSSSSPIPSPLLSKPGSRQGADEGGKASKGLRHFSMKVCKKVEEKGHTTYNEVADELVTEFMACKPEPG